MTIQNLERVMWRIRTLAPDKVYILNSTLREAIMKEIGTDPRTYQVNRKALIQLHWLKTRGCKRMEVTGNDISGE